MRRIILFTLLIFVSGLLTVKGQDDRPNLHLIVDRDLTLTVYVDSTEPLALNGLALRVVTELAKIETRKLEENFDSLWLTDGKALPGSCFVYVQSGTSPVLPDICSKPNQIYRRDVPRVDVFWYDFVAGRSRDIAIVANDVPTGIVCPWAVIDCSFTYIAPVSLTPTTPLEFSSISHNADWIPVIETFNNAEMVLVPPGCFMMGESREAQRQCFDKPFWIDRYEVTNAQYGSSGSFSGSDLPRESVTWFEARDFCVKRGGRLPSEKEWEYAARGPDNLILPWGNGFVAENVIYRNDSSSSITRVGSRPNGQSWVGAMDMAGNVWEWTNTIFQPYPYISDDGRENSTGNAPRVTRGGSFLSEGALVFSANRMRIEAEKSISTLGFRCARDFQPGDWTP